MHDEAKRREARMMEAVAGLAGRSALSGEVDLRLGVASSTGGFPSWIDALSGLLRYCGRALSSGTRARSPETRPF